MSEGFGKPISSTELYSSVSTIETKWVCLNIDTFVMILFVDFLKSDDEIPFCSFLCITTF